jgi:regulator of chromosome condensation
MCAEVPPITSVAAGIDHSLALTTNGEAYSWGFSESGRTGQDTENDIKAPTRIDCEATRGKKLTFVGAGGAFSILACVAV